MIGSVGLVFFVYGPIKLIFIQYGTYLMNYMLLDDYILPKDGW